MQPLGPEDILPVASFEVVRERLRDAVMRHKAARRVAVGDRVTLVFEDRETVRWQIQEMCRVEGIDDAAGVAGELAVYNELVPAEGELSATLFLEITDVEEIRPELDRLIGLDEHVALQIGDERLAARFDEKQLEEDRISAVQYVRFPIPDALRPGLADSAQPVQLLIDHPAYQAAVFLSPATRASLSRDLAGGIAPLLPAESVPPPEQPEILRETPAVRALRPLRPRGPGHVVIESVTPVAFCDAPAALLAEVMGLAQELAREIEARHGGCVLLVDAAGPLRCHLHAPQRHAPQSGA